MSLLDDVKYYRKVLHQIPELGFDLPKTHEFIKKVLLSFGYRLEIVAKTGIIAYREGRQPQYLAFRADMDALPIEEASDYPHPSRHKGQMHACGHDGHMALLLGFAKSLCQYPALNKGVLLIFQPAEETTGGAKPMIDEGIFQLFNVEAIFGYHLYPELEEGTIGLASGPLMAMATELDVEFIGKSGHGGKPHQAIDALLMACHFVQSVQTILTRTLDPMEPKVITFGKIQGGEARSSIMKNVKLEGTIRTFSERLTDDILHRLHRMAKGLEMVFNGTIDIQAHKRYPPVINDDDLFQTVDRLLESNEKEYLKPMMLAEDFAYYQQVVPGLFMMLGTRNEEKGYIHPLHSSHFNFREEALLKGIELYLKICRSFHVMPLD